MQPKTSIINLNSLLDLSASLYLSDDTDFIMNATMLSLMGKLLITKAAVYQYDISSNIYLPRIIKANFNIQIDNPQLSYEFEDLSKSGNNIPLYLQGVNYIVPIKINKEIFAVILLGKSIIEHTLSEEEANYINLVSNIAGNAVINALSIKSSIIAKEKAERHNQLLKTLFEIGRDFSTFISREQIIKNLSLNLMGQLTVSRFAVYVIDENQNFEELVNRFNLQFSQIWLQNICKSEIAERISNCNIHDSDPIARDISIIAPMKVKGNHKGMMLIGYKMSSSDFTDNDILFIEALGNTAIAALENERLIHEEIEKKKLENELNIALEIQNNLLPKNSPFLNNFEIFGKTIPSRHVGGDYYDFIELDKNRYLIAIADVSGKGIPASLIMANMQAALHVLTKTDYTLVELIEKTNFLIYHNTSSDKFVTGFFYIIDDEQNTIEYLNAGHNPPLFIKNNKLEFLNEGGLIIGFMENPPNYKSEMIRMESGDMMVAFTDGINEARDNDSNEYGNDKLENIVIQNLNSNPENLAKIILKDVDKFVNGGFQYDDQTIVILRKK